MAQFMAQGSENGAKNKAECNEEKIPSFWL
jgi:hypothetical protein